MCLLLIALKWLILWTLLVVGRCSSWHSISIRKRLRSFLLAVHQRMGLGRISACGELTKEVTSLLSLPIIVLLLLVIYKMIRDGRLFGRVPYHLDLNTFFGLSGIEDSLPIVRGFEGIWQMTCCSLCGSVQEIDLHVLRDCRFASEVWLKVLDSDCVRFFELDLNEWVHACLNDECRMGNNGISSNAFFSIICWLIGKLETSMCSIRF